MADAGPDRDPTPDRQQRDLPTSDIDDPAEATIVGADDFGWRYVYWGQLIFGALLAVLGWEAVRAFLEGGPRAAFFPGLGLVLVGFAFVAYLNNLYKDVPLADYSKSCYHCDLPVNRYSEFCEHCGADLVYRAEVAECPGCGEEVYAESPYCDLCGAAVAAG